MSSKRQFGGRQWAGRQYEPSLFRGVGSAVAAIPGPYYVDAAQVLAAGAVAAEVLRAGAVAAHAGRNTQ